MKQTLGKVGSEFGTASGAQPPRGQEVRSSAPEVVGRGAASVPNRFRGEAKPLCGLWADPGELGFGLPARHPWTALEQNLQSFPPPSSAHLAMPALTRPFATAVHINDGPSLFDELIESMGSTVRPLRLIPTILPSTHTALTLRPPCLRRAGSIASKLVERGRASRAPTPSSGRRPGDDATRTSRRCRTLDKLSLQSGAELDNDAGRRAFFEDALLERDDWADAGWDSWRGSGWA